MAKILAYWDCEYCATKKIPGNVRSCPNCGRPVGEKTKYYMDNSNKVYVKETEVPKGPDWRCNYCTSYNRFEQMKCKNCGAPKEGDSQNYFSIHQKNETSSNSNEAIENKVSDVENELISNSDYFNTNTVYNVNYGNYTNSYSNNYKNNNSSYNLKSNNFNVKIIGIILISILALLGITLLLIPKEKEIIVNSFEWERVMYI